MTEEETKQAASPGEGGMTADLARELFDRMSAEEPADFSLIEQYYHPDVRFQDPIQKVVGRDAFVEMSERLVRRCKELRSKANDVAQTGDVIFIQWTMEMRFGSAPLSIIEGVTRLRLDEHARVIEHRDYFDLWGDTLESIPGVGRLYRRFVGLMG
jgi:hypothetical protein